MIGRKHVNIHIHMNLNIKFVPRQEESFEDPRRYQRLISKLATPQSLDRIL